MTEWEHPHARALRLIDALLILVREKETENMRLRFLIEDRLHAPVQHVPIHAVRGNRNNRLAEVLRVLEQADKPLRNAEIASRIKASPAYTRHVLATLRDYGRAAQDADTKFWTVLRDAGEPSMRLIKLAIWLFVLLGPALGHAQPVLNPVKVIFEPSPDHDRTEPITGEPLVQRYVLLIQAVGAMSALTEVDLGKPTPIGVPDPATPDAKPGDIVAAPSVLIGLPVGVKHTATVVAVGPQNLRSSPSNATDPFGRAVPASAPPGKPKVTK